MATNEQQYVAYLRVSTQKQGYSGLGLEAQREIIKNFLHAKVPIAEYVEVESGRHNDRPKLKEALVLCKTAGATLIVAKLDRLARNVSFLTSLLDSGNDIVFCDFPNCNKMVIAILGAIAQYEAELTASRTKAALQAKKARGEKLGNPEHLMDKHKQAVAKSNKTNSDKAKKNPNNMRAVAFLKVMISQGKNVQEMTDILNNEGFVTAQGCRFVPATVRRLIKRYNLQ